MPETKSGDVASELTHRLYHSALTALAILFGASTSPAATKLSETAVDRYDPTPPGDALLWVPDAGVDGNLELAAGARFSYARSPLVFKTADTSEQVLAYQLTAHALFALELRRRFELMLDAPFVIDQAAGAHSRFESPSGAALGDLRIGLQSELVPAQGALPAGAVALELWLPTGDGNFASSPSARYGASAILGADLSPWLWRGRFGARYRRDETGANGLFGSELHAGAAIGFGFSDITFGLELVGATGIEQTSGWFSRNVTHLEALLSGRRRFGPFSLMLGAGPGLLSGAGTPAYRVIAGIEIATELSERRPTGGDAFARPDRIRSPSASAGQPRAEPTRSGPASLRSGPPERMDGASVRFVGTQLLIAEQIRFLSGNDKLLPESLSALGEVAKVLQAHPEIARVSVDGHTDDVGDDAQNLALSRRRALAVVRFLIEHGVDERRLEARGFGARQPLGRDKTDEARSKNRRVEFQIKRRSELGKRGWRDGAVAR